MAKTRLKPSAKLLRDNGSSLPPPPIASRRAPSATAYPVGMMCTIMSERAHHHVGKGAHDQRNPLAPLREGGLPQGLNRAKGMAWIPVSLLTITCRTAQH